MSCRWSSIRSTRKRSPLFGDGAGAALLTPDEDAVGDEGCGILAYRLASEGALSHLLVVPAGGSRRPICQEVVDRREQYLKMEGQAVFKWAVRLIPEVAHELLSQARLTLDDIDLFIVHQANRRILDSAIEHLGVPPEKLFMNLDEYGNTSAASIPISLDEAMRAGAHRQGKSRGSLRFRRRTFVGRLRLSILAALFASFATPNFHLRRAGRRKRPDSYLTRGRVPRRGAEIAECSGTLLTAPFCIRDSSDLSRLVFGLASSAISAPLRETSFSFHCELIGPFSRMKSPSAQQ